MELAIGTYVVFKEADILNKEVKVGTLGYITGYDIREDDNTVERYSVACFDEDMNETVENFYYDVSFMPILVRPFTFVKEHKNTQETCDCECPGKPSYRSETDNGFLCECVCHNQSR